MVSVREGHKARRVEAQSCMCTKADKNSREQEVTFVLLHSIGLDHCHCPLLGEEKVDLPLGLLWAVAAVQLVDGLVLRSELGSQTGRAQALESAVAGFGRPTLTLTSVQIPVASLVKICLILLYEHQIISQDKTIGS